MISPKFRIFNLFSTNENFQKIAYWSLIFTIFLTYWIYNSQYYGPAYLTDEVGYLTKAAVFAGYSIDLPNHWTGGYPLLLAPLFAIFDDPFIVWQAVMVLNALLWAFSFMILFRILRTIFPDQNFAKIYFAVAVSAVYPSWISMSGYAFTTSFYVFVYMLSILALMRSSLNSIFSILPHALLTGYLYWIHRSGLLVAASSLLVLLIYSVRYKSYKIVISYTVMAATLIAIYKFGIHHWLNSEMTPNSYKYVSNYKGIAETLKVFGDLEFWKYWLIMTLGHFSTIMISTFGIVFYGLMEIIRRFKLKSSSSLDSKEIINYGNVAMTFMGIVFVLVLLGSSIAFARNVIHRQVLGDEWIYARYLEMVLLPVMAIGLVVLWKLKYVLAATITVIITGIMLNYTIDASNTSHFIQHINIQSLWSSVVFPKEKYLFWYIVGAVGILAAFILKKKYFILLALPLWTVCIISHAEWHNDKLEIKSRPSSLYSFIVSNFSKGECIGFDPYLQRSYPNYIKERRNMYSYYFFDYNIKRMSPKEWLKSCNGPYLTYRPTVLSDNPNVKVLGREINTRFFLLIKTKDMPKISRESLRAPLTNYKLNLSGSAECFTEEYVDMNVSLLKRFAPADRYKKGAIVARGKNEFLLKGAKYPLEKGRYTLYLYGEFDDTKGSTLDIVSDYGRIKHFKWKLSTLNTAPSDQKEFSIPFTMDTYVKNAEVRLRVSPETNISIYGYSIKINKDK